MRLRAAITDVRRGAYRGKLCVVCQRRHKGQVEQFVHKFINGIKVPPGREFRCIQECLSPHENRAEESPRRLLDSVDEAYRRSEIPETQDRIQKVIDEIASDLSLYRSMGIDCSGVIAFIWDAGARTNEHDYLRQGLRKMPGLIDAVVVSRPLHWADHQVPKSQRNTTGTMKRR
jgi:hypothetical protein